MKVSLLLIAAVLFCPVPAFAHRLDEYLQASTIELANDRIVLQLHLTPGVSVAAQVLSGIDSNGDDVLSAGEQQSYAERVRQDLSLTLDGHPARLVLVSCRYPTVDKLRSGTRDIDLRFEARLPGIGRVHRLDFQNHHLHAIAMYLVNTLLPSDPTIRIAGQDRSYDQSSYQLRFGWNDASAGTDGVSQQRLIRADRLAVAWTYLCHGVHHILTGYDHLLFIGALVLGADTLWDLVKVVTAFTVAHSITLTLAALNLVHLPNTVVEPLISASIVFVAVQNIVWPEQSHSTGRLAVAFLFGLFHGLGFADGLLHVMHSMPPGMILVAILGFSLGVEAGNQAVLLPQFGILKLVRFVQSNAASRTRVTRAIQIVGSAGISAAGACYFCAALVAVL